MTVRWDFILNSWMMPFPVQARSRTLAAAGLYVGLLVLTPCDGCACVLL